MENETHYVCFAVEISQGNRIAAQQFKQLGNDGLFPISYLCLTALVYTDIPRIQMLNFYMHKFN
jgi:hypothetical protein